MATISPVLSVVDGIPRITWAGAKTGDTLVGLPVRQQYGLAAAVTATGTFGGATVTLEVSNDNTNWFPAYDTQGALVSLTAAGYADLSLAAAYIRPTVTGGTGDSVDIVMVMRGSNGV